MKKLFVVTGGFGHLGSTIIEILAKRGESVRALVLKGEKGERLPHVEYVEGDVRDRDAMASLLSHSDDQEIYLIHTAGLISIQDKGTKDLWSVNVEGTRNAIEAAISARAKRMVYVSSVHAIEERKDIAQLREPTYYDPALVKGEYAKSKATASQMVLDAASKGLDASIALPSGIIGPGDFGRNHLVQLCAMFLSGKLPMGVSGGYDMVDVRDVADGVLKIAEHGKHGESYILSGSAVSIKEIIRYMATASGKKEKRCVPLFIAKLAAPFFELDAKRKGKRPLFTKYSLMTLASRIRFSHDKAATELGYSPRDAAESVRDMVQFLLQKKLSFA